jgi:hypothetical protein
MMMQDSKTPFCCSKFPWTHERISPKIDNLGTCSQKDLPALLYTSLKEINVVISEFEHADRDR